VPVDRPRLSICLPTHHGRAAELDRALRSIAAQLPALPEGSVQVCVSDNGSHDATQEVLREHAEHLGGALTTFRFEVNQGFTPNLLKAVELADGAFCWLMGSDDEIAPGAVATVLEALAAGPGLSGLTLNRRNVDDEHPERAYLDDPRVIPAAPRATYTDAASAFADLAMLQDYISTQVVHRERWHAAVAELGPEGIAAGRNFPHMPILGAVIRKNPRWGWIGEPLVEHRVGERSVSSSFEDGLTAYTVMVTDDREQIWRAMFGRGTRLYREALRNIWRVQAHPVALAHLRRQPDQTLALDVALLRSMVRAYRGLPEFWLQSLPVLVLPSGLIDAALAGMRRLKAARRPSPR